MNQLQQWHYQRQLKIIEFIRDLEKLANPLFLLSHNPWDAHMVADRFVILERGKVVYRRP
jgi:ABC-type multidrug transport system ATPase subunit